MKIPAAVLIAISLCACLSTASARERLGIGLIAGEPSGLSMKWWFSELTAIDLAAAWSFSENDSFQLHADYLVHDYTIATHPKWRGKTPVYYGGGLRIKERDDRGNSRRNNDETLVGIRVPVGISYLFPESPVDLFAEFVPTMDVAPRTRLDIGAAIGIRYYFF